MPQRPDGKAAKNDRVVFTAPAAERISKVVRTVEAGNRDCLPLTFSTRQEVSAAKAFRICTFTAPWFPGSTQTVTLSTQSSTPATAVATNLFFPVSGNASMDGAIARDGTTWYLIDVPFRTASAVFIASISVSASLNTNSCAITVSTTAATATATFLRIGIV